MYVYFSGVGGVGIGPLMEIARDAGYSVAGSDQIESLMTRELSERGFTVFVGQTGQELSEFHTDHHVDWFVYTAALPDDNPELIFARANGIRTSKRDEFLAELLHEKDLKLIAVAGTHGKTTTTGMFVWAAKQLGIPVSYSVGTNLSFGPSGYYDSQSKVFVYECDEYDRNFLHFSPWVSLVTSIDYDHPDTYPTENAYFDAFDQFIRQSNRTIMWQQDLRDLEIISGMDSVLHLIDKEESSEKIDSLKIAGRHNRENAYLVLTELVEGGADEQRARDALESFPGSTRRFEKLAANLYSDYGHHPSEIAATLQLARELSDHVVLVYQPHQNVRQHEVKSQYTSCMEKADEIYWLPTYLSREDPALEVLTPEQLSENLSNRERVYFANMDQILWQKISDARADGKLVLCMGAGSIDDWLRHKLAEQK